MLGVHLIISYTNRELIHLIWRKKNQLHIIYREWNIIDIKSNLLKLVQSLRNSRLVNIFKKKLDRIQAQPLSNKNNAIKLGEIQINFFFFFFDIWHNKVIFIIIFPYWLILYWVTEKRINYDVMSKIGGMLHKLWKENSTLETEVEFKRRWLSVLVIYFTIFLMTLGFGITLTGVWPYLDKVNSISRDMWCFV